MNVSCRTDGATWTREGIRQAQLLGMEYVPSVTPAAMMAPAYQLSLNKPLMTLVWRGYVNSAINCEAPEIQNGMPMPRRRRATRNMAMLTEAVWRITPTTMIAEPTVILCFLPSLSFV